MSTDMASEAQPASDETLVMHDLVRRILGQLKVRRAVEGGGGSSDDPFEDTELCKLLELEQDRGRPE